MNHMLRKSFLAAANAFPPPRAESGKVRRAGFAVHRLL